MSERTSTIEATVSYSLLFSRLSINLKNENMGNEYELEQLKIAAEKFI